MYNPSFGIFSGNDTKFFLGVIMKALTRADLEGWESYIAKHPKSHQEEFHFGYAYASNVAWVDYRPIKSRKYGIYGKFCIVSDSAGNWIDTFGLPGAGFNCLHPSICEKIN